MIERLQPTEALARLQSVPGTMLIDVRDPVERALVGHPVGSVNIPWAFAPGMRPNPAFLDSVRQQAPDPATPLLLLCRSGQRSLAAAEALAAAGYTRVANVEEGFEGPLDEQRHRNTLGGWRRHGLPWEQG